jgi:nucleoid-associated protein YgaU
MRELALAGWVAIPNTGKVPLVSGEILERDAGGGGDRVAENDSQPVRRAHVEKGARFEIETTRPAPKPEPDPRGNGSAVERNGIPPDDGPPSRRHTARAQIGSSAGQLGRSDGSSSTGVELAPDSGATRVDTVYHVVEPKENFWTIAGLYYGSPRYYRALWKANASEYPKIDRLYVNDIVKIPPPEDLDPAYIDPPKPRSVATRGGESPRPDSGRRIDLEDEPAPRGSRVARASRAVAEYDPIPASRPVYKVRLYDTLRTIARDTLGDSRRADEIAELNRGVIDDPRHLIVGQLIELPEDASTRMRRRN